MKRTTIYYCYTHKEEQFNFYVPVSKRKKYYLGEKKHNEFLPK